MTPYNVDEGSAADGWPMLSCLSLTVYLSPLCHEQGREGGGCITEGLSPIFVVDNHIYQHAQHSGELGRIWRQLHSWGAPSFPFDLFTRFLSGLRLLLSVLIALALLQTHVHLHLHRGSDLSCVRLRAEGVEGGDVGHARTDRARRR